LKRVGEECPTVKRVMEVRTINPNSETGDKEPINPPQKALLRKDERNVQQ